MDLLNARPRSEAELRAALTKKKVPKEIQEEICSRFKEVGLIDDSSYASSLVNSRSRYSRQGAARIHAELRRKGISTEIAEEAVSQITETDELEAARAVAQKKMRTLRGESRKVAERRLAGVLARRGFSQSTVIAIVNESLVDWTDSS